MSFLTEVSSSGGSSNGGSLDYNSGGSNPPSTDSGGSYDYHLPHTKTIDLIGEEFAPRKDSPTITTGSSIAIVTSSGGLPVSSTLFLNSNNILTTLAPLSGCSNSSSILQAISASGGQVVTLPNVSSLAPNPGGHHELLSTNSSPSVSADAPTSCSTVITTLPFNPGGQTGVLSDVISQPITSTATSHANPEENGVLLCNLDELSRYIPETFYSDFNITEPKLDYLDSKQGIPSLTTVSALGSSSVMVSSGSPILSTSSNSAPISALSNTLGATSFHTTASTGTPITIQLPTQPQPPQGVKTLTYVQNNKQNSGAVSNTGGLQPVKLTTGFAYTATGEKFSIQGLTDPSKNSTVQVQVKPQTLQLAGLDPSKLAVLQELPDVSKVVIQEQSKSLQSSSITNLLEDMKSPNADVTDEGNAPVGYTTAIPVAVSSINGSQLKKSGATVLMPNKRSRNIIFAGNTLPQGAIPIQINGLNALPISAVKSIPLNIGSLASPLPSSSTPVQAVRKAPTPKITTSQLTTQKQVNSIKCPVIATSAASNIYTTPGTNTSSTKAIGNNKTCTWVFENGEVCGKTFSKSYNLVVHMRMHEDVRPFCCSLCDQTFRQKAHLQRHETTHGIGVKVSRNSSNLKKRKKNKNLHIGSTNTTTQIVLPSPGSNINLQKRLSRADEKFSKASQNNNNNNSKFSSSDIDEAIKAAVEGSSLVGSSPPLLSLKREPPDDEALHHASKIPHMSVKVESTENESKSSQSGGSPITAQFVQHPGSTTIVIDNLEDHSPEIQKEILNALLADHGTGLFTIQGGTGHTTDDKDGRDDDGRNEGSSQSFPPVTVQEFLQENSPGGHILVENSSPD